MTMITITINNMVHGPLDIDPEVTMLEFLHEYLNLTGTKFGCGQGICSACVVIQDNDDGTSEVHKTCITNAVGFNGKKLRTIEGHAELDKKGEIIALHPVQESFIKHFSFQCGWCTSGFTNHTVALIEELKRNPIPVDQVEAKIEATLGEHVCRCTGYVKYYAAVKDAILKTKGATL